MQVQPAPANDLEAMLDTPRKGEGPPDAATEVFEMSLVQALLESSQVETEDELTDRDLTDGAVVDDVSAQTATEVRSTVIVQSQGAILRSTSISPSVQDSSQSIEGHAPVSAEDVRLNRGSTEQPDSERPVPLGRIESAPSVAVVGSATLKRDHTSASGSARPPMSDSDAARTTATTSAVASPPAIAQIAAVEVAASQRDPVEHSTLASVSSGSIPAEAKRQTLSLDREPSARGPELRPLSTAIDSKAPVKQLDRPNVDSAEAPPVRQDLPRAERVVDEIPLASTAPLSAPTLSAPPTGIQPAGVDPLVGGVANPVSNTEPAPRATSPQPVDALPQNIQLLASRGGGTARLQLHPAELGEIEITVSIRGDAVDVSIQAIEPAARAAVMAHRDQLANSLGSRELRMEGFDVSSGGREQGAGGRQTQSHGADGRPDWQTRSLETTGGGTGHPNGIAERAATVAASYHQQGIDLRI